MTHTELVKFLAKPGVDILPTLTPRKIHLIHMTLGLAGEAAELIDGQWLRAEAVFDRDNFIEEMGDLEFYFEGIRQEMDFDLDVLEETEVQLDEQAPIEIVLAIGEVIDVIKKHTMYDRDLQVTKLFIKMRKLRDAMTSAYLVAQIERWVAIEANKVKLGIRYPGGYSDKAATVRADKE